MLSRPQRQQGRRVRPVLLARAGLTARGETLALPFVYVVNQIRVVALFFAYCFARDSFAFLHGYAAPTTIVIACGIFFLTWLQLGQARPISQ